MFTVADFVARQVTDYRQFRRSNDYRHQNPRQPTTSEHQSWSDAAAERVAPKTRAAIVRSLVAKNPVRMHRLAKDYRWVQKEMKKMGLNPEDARELF